MKRTIVALAIAASLSGCAGIQTAWVFQMQYQTPEDKPVNLGKGS